jgi:beta-mannanase
VAGNYDAAFVTGLGQLNQLNTPTYFIFHHEPDTDTGKRSCSTTDDAVCGAEFVTAWKHVYALAKTNGYTNIDFVWTMTIWGFSPQTNVRNRYYWPGNAFTDWVGFDAYNFACNTTSYLSFSDMLAKTIAWTQTNSPDKPIMLAEWGAPEGSTPTAKADFFNGVPAALVQPGYDHIRAMSYWNQASNCNFRVDSSAASLGAFTSLGFSSLIAQ